MKKRRVTLNLDEDVVEALEAVGGRRMSSVANDALREALEVTAHRAALREWLDELDEKYGAPSPEQLAAAKICSTPSRMVRWTGRLPRESRGSSRRRGLRHDRQQPGDGHASPAALRK